jgi:hypothetical protein
MERLIDPVVADIQTEHAEAVRAGRWWRAASIRARGYVSFWMGAGLHILESGPRTLWRAVAADGAALGRMIAYAFVGCIALTLCMSAWPMFVSYSHHPRLDTTLLLVPQAVPISMPVALSLAIVCGVDRMRLRRHRSGVLGVAIVATMLAFSAMLMLPATNQAWRVAMAQEFGMRGIPTESRPKGLNELSFSQLGSKIREYEASGHPERARLARRVYHMRFALPAATLALSLLALGICGAVRSRLLRVVAVVIGLGVYWAILGLAMKNPTLPPSFSAWAPNIVLTATAFARLGIRSGQESAEPAG